MVASNDKQRFSLIHSSAAPSSDPAVVPADDAATESQQPASNDPSDYLIRANQGHSIAVESDGLLTPVSESDIPEIVVHGTTHGAWPLIVATGGLKRMTRTHVHFASGLPAGFESLSGKPDETLSVSTVGDGTEKKTAAPVISGMRNSSSLLVFLDIRKAMAAGLKFWKSENGVILSEGDEEGVISLQFFKRVEDRIGGMGTLVEDGVVLKEAPEAWTKKGTGRRGGRGGGSGGSRGH